LTIANKPLRCLLLGHRFRFRAEGAAMLWRCERCEERGRKLYDSPARARRYALALDREDRGELGRRAPLLGMFPLRIAHWLRTRSARDRSGRHR
jgi:hypothetical protein